METEAEPLMPEAVPQAAQPSASKSATIAKLPWIPLAAASGACAAFNGVFAKLYANCSLFHTPGGCHVEIMLTAIP